MERHSAWLAEPRTQLTRARLVDVSWTSRGRCCPLALSRTCAKDWCFPSKHKNPGLSNPPPPPRLPPPPSPLRGGGGGVYRCMPTWNRLPFSSSPFLSLHFGSVFQNKSKGAHFGPGGGPGGQDLIRGAAHEEQRDSGGQRPQTRPPQEYRRQPPSPRRAKHGATP